MSKRTRAVTLVVAVLLVGGAFSALPAKAGQDHKVTICHRTNSPSHPYVQIKVDDDAVDENTGNDHGKGDHNAQHNGPVFDSETVYTNPRNGDAWGDIIPPFYADGDEGYWQSKNWTDAGEDIFNNGCRVPGETPICPVNPSSVNPSTTECDTTTTEPEEEETTTTTEGGGSTTTTAPELIPPSQQRPTPQPAEPVVAQPTVTG